MYLLAEENAVPVQDITNVLPKCLPVSKTIRILLSVHERNPIDNHVDVGIRLPMDVIGHLIAVCKESTACICDELHHRQRGSLPPGKRDNDVLNTCPIVFMELLCSTLHFRRCCCHGFQMKDSCSNSLFRITTIAQQVFVCRAIFIFAG